MSFGRRCQCIDASRTNSRGSKQMRALRPLSAGAAGGQTISCFPAPAPCPAPGRIGARVRLQQVSWRVVAVAWPHWAHGPAPSIPLQCLSLASTPLLQLRLQLMPSMLRAGGMRLCALGSQGCAYQCDVRLDSVGLRGVMRWALGTCLRRSWRNMGCKFSCCVLSCTQPAAARHAGTLLRHCAPCGRQAAKQHLRAMNAQVAHCAAGSSKAD